MMMYSCAGIAGAFHGLAAMMSALIALGAILYLLSARPRGHHGERI